jgi:diguanylate cyclase (GGDEF)-like protein
MSWERGLAGLGRLLRPTSRRGVDEYLDADRRVVAERVAEIFRWLFIFVLAVLNNFGGVRLAGSQLAVDLVLAAWAAVNLLITVLLLRGHQPGPNFGLATLVVDIFAGATLVYFSTGLTSPYVLALFLAIIASAVRFGLVYSVMGAVVIGFIYLFVGGSAPLADYVAHPEVGLETAGRIFLFIIVALVTGLLGEELARERRLAVSRAAQAEALQHMSSALAYSLDVNDLFEVVLQQAVKITNADSGGLILVGSGRLQLAAYHGRGGRSDKAALAKGDPLVDRVIRTREPIHIRSDRDPDHELLGMTPPLSAMLVPITVGERTVAVLRLTAFHREAAFSDQQFFMVNALAGSASGPLANALRYERKTREAITDGLTRLLNHREFRHRVDLEYSRYRRRGTAFGVMLIDIDHFKAVNDSMGHAHGDEVLKAAADLVMGAVREHDIVCRYGGDEIAVLLPDTEPEQARSAAERLVAACHRAAIQATPSQAVTFSIGVASCPTDGLTVDEVLMAADQALYFAKRAGRDGSAAAGEMTRRYEADAGLLLKDLADHGPQLVVAIARVLDLADPAGPGHVSRIAVVAELIVRKLMRPEGELELVRSAALLHEAGRLGDQVGELRWEHEHPMLTEQVLRGGRFLPELAGILRHHHERWDGRGHPDGLAGEEIPLPARVLAVAEAYEAMVSRGLSALEALDRLAEESGKSLDPRALEVLAGLIGEGDRLGSVLRPPAPKLQMIEASAQP